ncbi:MAG: Gfo/Idh/MocA family oxidoreductase [Anaerolineae bacterium]|jgi:predicted dehydrogenase|nr:Gfo/Idh/MocA family oxidoreductase [Anaerolineae bacterium]MBT7071638.1 Gfo/Idh/MocA family oxidoreductase [Anaerolineae bacterium]MBT7326509.1 Gfo/Idh/MocA family oxidoreductase [Anaerolineae bacterium]
MKAKFKWGIIAPGKIAHAFAEGIKTLPDAEVYAIASSSQERADAFAKKFKVAKTYNAYETLVADPSVDAVYISSPHHLHFSHSMLALNAGKPVLCEKPFTVNAVETEKLLKTAKEKNLFIMEALWTRFLPIYGIIRKWLNGGRIGEITLLTSTFGFRPERNKKGRLLNPDLAGGALLDIGIYPLSVSQWVMDEHPESFKIHALMGETGVDELLAGVLIYKNGVVSQFSSNFLSENINDFYIYGTKGHIRIHPNFWGSTQATLNVNGKEKTTSAPFNATGFEYQTAETMRCIRAGLLESPVMPHSETLSMMRLMDSIRAEIGLQYPFE